MRRAAPHDVSPAPLLSLSLGVLVALAAMGY
jgi:hypothetical protein